MDGTGYDKLHQQDIHYPQRLSNQITITPDPRVSIQPRCHALIPPHNMSAMHKLAIFCHIGGLADMKISLVCCACDDSG